MPIRITGLNSGLDTESIISALVSSYNYKTQKYEKAQTKLSWKQDAWKELNTKIYSLYNNVGNLRLGSAYNAKTANVSDSSKISVTAGSGAVNGTYSVRVESLAKAGYLTGSRLKEGVKKSSTLSDLGYKGKDGVISVTVNGETTDVDVSGSNTITEVLTKLQEAGVNASYDESNRRFFISSKKTGTGNDFVLEGKGAEGADILTTLGINYVTDAQKKEYEKLVAYADLDVAGMKALVEKKAELTRENNLLGKENDQYQKVLGYADLIEGIYNIKQRGTAEDFEALKEQVTSSNPDDTLDTLARSFGLITDTTDEQGNPVEDRSALTVFQKALLYVENSYNSADDELKAMYAEIDAAAEAGTLTDVVSEYEDKIAENENKIAENTVALDENEKIVANMSYDEILALDEKAKYAKAVLAKNNNDEATRIVGSDAVIYVNDAKYEGEGNTFSINGMTFTAIGETGTQKVTASVNTDVQGIYDKVKDFLSQYNAIINEMTALYNADSAKGYEPLTSEEKDAMSDTEVEKWEEKVKKALLRRDDTLSGIISTMTTAMSKSVKVNGKDVYLSEFGIQTLGFLNASKNEHNAYHIDGDEDDANTSGKTDKLMAAIADDPDKVIEFMKGLSKNLYESIDAKMKSTTLSSSYTIYNDKEMASEYSDYTSLITKWQDRLEQQEEYYYKKFAAMEKALGQLNSQTTSLSGLFGGM